MLGRRVRVPERIARVVSLAPSLTEIVYALGAGSRLVGVTDQCNFPPEVLEKPKVGGFFSPSFEVILSLRPDLVLASTEVSRDEHVRGLEQLGIPVYVVRPSGFTAVLESVERVGVLLGRPDEAARLAASMRGEAEAIARRVQGTPRPRVLYVVWGDPLIVPGRETLITDLIHRAGGESVTGDEPLAYSRFSAEAALARRPDRVILARHGTASVDDRLREWPHLGLLPAVRAGRVHMVDGDLVLRPGPRVVDGLRLLARVLHPEAGW